MNIADQYKEGTVLLASEFMFAPRINNFFEHFCDMVKKFLLDLTLITVGDF